MCALLSIYKSGKSVKRSLPPRRLGSTLLKSPTEFQLSCLRSVLPVVLDLAGSSFEQKRQKLNSLGYELVEKRVPRLCFVGSYWWYPR